MPNTEFRVKQHDTRPEIPIDCTDEGQPVDLTVAQSIRIIGARQGAKVFDKTVTGDAAGRVMLALDPADTVKDGMIRVEVEVTWAAGAVQTFPPAGYLSLWVEPDLG